MGFDINPSPDQVEAFFPNGNTGIMEDVDGFYYVTGLIRDDAEAEKIVPSYAFDIIWDSRDLVNVGTDDEPIMANKPRPTITVDDGDGGTKEATIGWI